MMKIYSGLLVAGVVLFGAGVLGGAEEPIVASLVAGGASAVTYMVALRRRLTKLERGGPSRPSLPPAEARLSTVEAELDRALTEIQQLRAAQEFDRELLATRRERSTPGA